MTPTASPGQAVTPAMKVSSSNARVKADDLIKSLPSATVFDPIIVCSSDEDSDGENSSPEASRKQSPIQIRGTKSTSDAKQPEALLVTAEKNESRGRRLVSLLDDSDSEDDEFLFGNCSVFDKNYRSSKKKAQSTRAEETRPHKSANQASPSESNKKIYGNDRKTVRPDLTASAKLTPKEAKRNAKREIREIDLTATMSDSEIENHSISDTKATPRDSKKPFLKESKPRNSKSKDGENKQEEAVLPTVASSANIALDRKEEREKFKQEMSKTKAVSMIVEPQLTPEQVKEERIVHLKNISGHRDRALQLLLWEIGFSYNVYAHQFDALLFVAGLNSKFPFSGKETSFLGDDSSDGANARSMVLQQAANEFLACERDRKPPGGGWLHILPTKGMLLADEMGLGKTIEALAGAALRNAMLSYDQNHSDLPTLIVSPQDGIQNQWYETLLKSGVQPVNIEIWGESKIQSRRRQEQYLRARRNDTAKVNPSIQSYILCTRYNIQSEMRRLFQGIARFLQTKKSERRRMEEIRKIENEINTYKAKTLFREIPLLLIGKLQNQYQAGKGKTKNKFIHEREKVQDCVGRLVLNGSSRNQDQVPQFSFQTIIVDEAHFCKNVLAYWGLGLALLGKQTRRSVLLTGTPYNNGPHDMTALMTYIDPAHEASKIEWWEKAVESSGDQAAQRLGAADNVSLWRKAYLMRRTKDVLLQKLPPRIRTDIDVGPVPSELWIYETYESIFLDALRKLRNSMEARSPEARLKAKKTFEVMMSCMAIMRMALVHPILPNGREVTIQFSPSRKHLLKREENPRKCVFCLSDPTRATENRKKKDDKQHQQQRREDNEDEDLRDLVGAARTEMDLDDDQLDDEDFGDDYEAKSKKERELEERKKGPIVPLGSNFCCASGSSCQHFAHEKCIEARCRKLEFECPRCNDLKNRMNRNLSQTLYCQEISTHIHDPNTGGFIASAKIEKAIHWFQTTVPNDDKAIFLSFYKSSLDLIEGILVSKFGIDCARYDGDVTKEVRTQDLQRFKTDSTCRVLLATVQSGGTGLNITEANHVCFLDRWFNPCVHDQAESRCHRIGQKKQVNIAYLDTNFTIDIVMKRINVMKEGNASVILADGTSLGDTRWSLGYRSVSGVIGETMKELQAMRKQAIDDNGDAPLPPYKESDLEERLAMAKQKPNVDQKQAVQKVESLPQNWEEWSYPAVISTQAAERRPSDSKKDILTKQRLTEIRQGQRPTLTMPNAQQLVPIPTSASSIRPLATVNHNSSYYRPMAVQPLRSMPVTKKKKQSLPQNALRRIDSVAPPPPQQQSQKRSRFSQGLSAIVSKKRRTLESRRFKKRGDL